MHVTVSIVSYNSSAFIQRCLESVLCQRNVTLEIIVVDNASTDNTVALLETYGLNVRIIANSKNVGFGTAHNQSFLFSSGGYFYILNPDTSIVGDTSLKVLCEYMRANQSDSLVSTGIDGLTEPPWSATYPGERYLKTVLPQLPGEIAWVLGASMFVRRECFAAVKGFDEEFFLYSEETDLCLRLRKAGFRIGYVPEVLVTHTGGASEGGSPAYDVWKRKIDSLYLFYEKHYSNSDKKRLINRDLRRARLQLFLASLNFPFQGNLARKAKYRAILDSGLRWIGPAQG